MRLCRRHFHTFPVCFPPDKVQPPPEQKPPPELEAVTTADSPEPKTPAVAEVKRAAAAPTLPMAEEVPSRPSISLDTILNQELHSLTSDIKNIMQSHRICVNLQLPPRLPPRHCWLPDSCFSDFVVPYVSPVPVQGHVKALCEKMDKLIPAPPALSKVTSPPPPVTSNLTTPSPTPMQTKLEPSLSRLTNSSQSCKPGAPAKAKSDPASTEFGGGDVYSPPQITAHSPETNTQNPGATSGTGPGLLAGSLIGQLKPEVFSSLVEIFKDVTKNTVKFYIYSGDEGEESTVCKEIKVPRGSESSAAAAEF